MSKPLISIITPSLNRAQYIREAIQSVLDQKYPHFEHIVIDGVSTDGTMEILREYTHLRLVSEQDNGMYDAINKGIRMAKGEIIGLLNTDDLYVTDAFNRVSEAFSRNPDVLSVVGGIATFEDKNGIRKFVNHIPAIASGELWVRLIQGHPVTNAWFFRKILFDQRGYFDANLRYAADRYFLIKIALDDGVRPVPLDRELYYYRKHSGSVTISTLDSRSPEHGLLRMKFLCEDISALETFLDRPVLPYEIRQIMRREHSERCYRLAATALYHRSWKQVFYASHHGFRYNALWPFIFIVMAMKRMRKEIEMHE